jgi:hypothetical protein
MQRAHKIRLNPTPEQQAYFRKAVVKLARALPRELFARGFAA